MMYRCTVSTAPLTPPHSMSSFSWNDARAFGGFALRVKAFFRENNMALDLPKVWVVRSGAIRNTGEIKTKSLTMLL